MSEMTTVVNAEAAPANDRMVFMFDRFGWNSSTTLLIDITHQ